MDQVLEDVDVILDEPRKATIIIHNDEVTSFEFVIKFLTDVFEYRIVDAEVLAMEVHESNKGVIGVWPINVAATLFAYAKDYLKEEKSKLKITLENAE